MWGVILPFPPTARTALVAPSTAPNDFDIHCTLAAQLWGPARFVVVTAMNALSSLSLDCSLRPRLSSARFQHAAHAFICCEQIRHRLHACVTTVGTRPLCCDDCGACAIFARPLPACVTSVRGAARSRLPPRQLAWLPSGGCVGASTFFRRMLLVQPSLLLPHVHACLLTSSRGCLRVAAWAPQSLLGVCYWCSLRCCCRTFTPASSPARVAASGLLV